nr:hypothetical protein BaRGS_019619 [Batillaria attramentaria]
MQSVVFLGTDFPDVDVFKDTEPEASEAVPLAAIAGGVGGAVALLIVIVIVTLVAISRRKKAPNRWNLKDLNAA